MISNLIKIELAYINTSHPDFIGGSRAVAQLMDRVSSQSPIDTTQISAQLPRDGQQIVDSNDDKHTGLMGLFRKGKQHEKPERSKDGLVKLPQVPETMRRQSEQPTDRERIETEIIKSLIESYFDIVRKNFMDLVPKAIMYFLVNNLKEHLQNELVAQLYRESMMAEMMRETPDVAQRREEIHEMRALLQKALDIVNEVRDYNSFAMTHTTLTPSAHSSPNTSSSSCPRGAALARA